jgi:xanthine dehydrogenase accessory factor
VHVLRAACAAIESGESVAMVTVVGVNGSAPQSAGARMLVWADGSIEGTVGGGTFEHRVIAQAQEALAAGRPRRFAVHLTRDLGMCCGGAMEAFIEPLDPDIDLVIHGAGHVGRDTARLAATAGFRVTVVDDRDDLLTAERFPDAAHLIEADPRRVLADLPTGPRAWHLIVTHSHALDQDLVEHLLPQDLGWVGLIGSRAKVARFLVRLRAGGMDPALFRRLSAPVGLDIGAVTPGEIAVSIVAELVRVRRGSQKPPVALSEVPLAARGGDGRAVSLAMQAGAPGRGNGGTADETGAP